MQVTQASRTGVRSDYMTKQEGNSLKDLRRMNDQNDLKNRLNDPDNYDIIIYNYIINIIY